MRINYSRFFLAADLGGGSGNSAVLDGPITPAEVTVTPSSSMDDILSYEPPSTDAISEFVDGKSDAVIELPAKTPEPKLDTPAKEETQTTKEPEQKKEGEGPVHLRKRLGEQETEITTLKSERDQLKQQLEEASTNREAADLRKQIADKEAEIKSEREEKAALERKLVAHNPQLSRRLTELQEKFNGEIKDVYEIVPSLAPVYRNLVDQFQALPHGKPEYTEKLREFKTQLRNDFDDDANTVFDTVRKGVKYLADYTNTQNEVQRDGQKMLFEEQRKDWEGNFKKIETEFDEWFNPPADAESTDPMNQFLFLKKFESEVCEPEYVKEMNAGIKRFVQNVHAGPQPRTKDDFPGMSDDQIKAEMAKIEERVSEDRRRAPQLQAQGMKALVMNKFLIAHISKLQSRLKEKEGSAAPDPTKQDGLKPSNGTNDDLESALNDMPDPFALERTIR